MNERSPTSVNDHVEGQTRPGPVHPAESDLQRFFFGELPRQEALTIVRHLLSGCSRCRSVTRRVWQLADEPLTAARRGN